ncbi:MAG: hypothetical protein JXA21_29840, partial [Anaerolineae bacterium]|nr:hypothetical protein [Anaerolineae bacterium]
PLTRGLKRGFCGRADSPAKTLLLSLGLQGRDFHPTAGERQLMRNSFENRFSGILPRHWH